MTVTYRFFENGDYYSQENFADFIRSLLTDGYIPNVGNELAVSATSPATMAVNIGTGMAVIHGYIVENENSPVTIPIDAPHSSLPRIDRIIIRLSATSNRNITFTILKGTPASSPAAPTLTQNEETFELSLAQIRVNANVSTISSGNITNERKQAYNAGVGYPKASSSSFGIVKVGTGIRVDNGLITVPYSSYPLIAHLYGTDQNLGTFILGNVYNGTEGQLPQGLIFDDESVTGTRRLTLSFVAESGENASTSSDSWEWSASLSLRNVITRETRNVGSWSGRMSLGSSFVRYMTLTKEVDVKWYEVAVASVSSWGAYYSGFTRFYSSNFGTVVNAYLGGIPPE